MRTWRAAPCLLLPLLLARGPALAQPDVLGQGTSHATTATSAPASLPDLPDLAPFGASALGAGWYRRGLGGHFEPLLDTPVFDNHAFHSDVWDSPGTCAGMCFLVRDWYQEIVAPILRTAEQDPLLPFLRVPTSLTDVLGVPGPIHRDNLEEHRLRAYSRDEAQRVGCVRQAVALHRQFNELPRRTHPAASTHRAHEELLQRILGDLSDPSRRFSLIWFRVPLTNGDTSAHAVLAYEAYDGTVPTPEMGIPDAEREPREVIRIQFYDPSDVLTPENFEELVEQNFLLYFPHARRFAFSREYVRAFNASGRFALQPGPFLGAEEIRSMYMDEVRALMRYRSIYHDFSGVPDRAYSWESDE